MKHLTETRDTKPTTEYVLTDVVFGTMIERSELPVEGWARQSTTLQGVNKANAIIKSAQRLEKIEGYFMAVASKANRADNQRDRRRASR
tara:strand:+ start:389 stop:655 length:267 start_codon:yes stop_codon:yes gene_type:complete